MTARAAGAVAGGTRLEGIKGMTRIGSLDRPPPLRASRPRDEELVAFVPTPGLEAEGRPGSLPSTPNTGGGNAAPPRPTSPPAGSPPSAVTSRSLGPGSKLPVSGAGGGTRTTPATPLPPNAMVDELIQQALGALDRPALLARLDGLVANARSDLYVAELGQSLSLLHDRRSGQVSLADPDRPGQVYPHLSIAQLAGRVGARNDNVDAATYPELNAALSGAAGAGARQRAGAGIRPAGTHRGRSGRDADPSARHPCRPRHDARTARRRCGRGAGGARADRGGVGEPAREPGRPMGQDRDEITVTSNPGEGGQADPPPAFGTAGFVNLQVGYLWGMDPPYLVSDEAGDATRGYFSWQEPPVNGVEQPWQTQRPPNRHVGLQLPAGTKIRVERPAGLPPIEFTLPDER